MKTENKKTLRGSVLFTVVCVMALLIIFLTGTLALASASSNRAHKSYASLQASYTARAAIDTFVQSMEREPGIPAAIENMGETPLEVEMEIPDSTLGVLGYYNDKHEWQKNKIIITPVADSEGYVYTDITPDGVDNPEWIAVTAVKVTATCRVGKEEETVSAYIKKSGATHSEITPGGLDGLQEVGGNSFANGGLITGGFGLGISKDNTGLYVAHNETTVETKSTFINGNLVVGTSSFNINIKNPYDENNNKLMPNSQTVILGSVFVHHTKNFINLYYDMTQNYTQKDIPYVYIDGTIAGDTGLTLARVHNASDNSLKNGTGRAPFNFFVGTFNSYAINNDVQIGGADMYMMDEYTPSESYTVMWADRSYSVDELAGTDVDRDTSNDISEVTINGVKKKIIKGDNYFGANSKSLLFDWTSSYVHKTESQHKSTGGNIYCMGNLTLHNAEINGDVRVNGDCTINGGNVSITGDLVVKGKLTFEDNAKGSCVSGTIYCDNIIGVSNETTGAQVKPGYVEHVNELVPGYVEVNNAVYPNDEAHDCAICDVAQDPSHDYKLAYDHPTNGHVVIEWGTNDAQIAQRAQQNGGKLYVVGDNLFDAMPYNPTTYDGIVDTSKVVTSPVTIYKVDPNDPSVILSGDGNGIVTEDEISYYRCKDDGSVSVNDEADKSDAVRTYYTREGDPNTVVSRAEACNEFATTVYPAYTGSGKEPAYPASMTREAIYGYYDESGEFQVNGATKLIKNIREIRRELNMDENGEFNKNIYLDHVPKRYCDNATNDTYDDNPYTEDGKPNPNYNGDDPEYTNQLPLAFNSDGTKNTNVWDGNTIVKSCIIGNEKPRPTAKGSEAPTFDLGEKGTINIKGSGDGIWVVLRNCTTESKHGADILCDTTAGKVCILIDGDLAISKTDIRPSTTGNGVNAYTSGCTVTPKSNWNLEFYGSPDSAIRMYQNECTLVGTFMCPQTTFASKVAGKTPCNYIDEYGVERKNIASPIVGSALFYKIADPKDPNQMNAAQNSFGVLNSGSGGSSGETGTAHTALGTFEISYFTGS